MKRLAILAAIALLGAAQAPQNPAYAPYIGTWQCTRPALGSTSWTAVMTVAPSGDALDFVSQQTSPTARVAGPRTALAPSQPQSQAPQMQPPPNDVTSQEVVSHFGPDHFTIRENPQTGTWSETAPEDAFDKTGTVQPDGAILFAAPAPEHQRMKLRVSPDGKTMKMLWYLNNTHKLNYAPDVIECTR